MGVAFAVGGINPALTGTPTREGTSARRRGWFPRFRRCSTMGSTRRMLRCRWRRGGEGLRPSASSHRLTCGHSNNCAKLLVDE